jgi:hypothetical protein
MMKFRQGTHFPGLLVCQIRQIPLYILIIYVSKPGQTL